MNIPRSSLPYLVPGITGAASFAIYLSTLARSVGFIDSGELAAVASTLGVAHPSGYPLFTLLGWLWTRIPFPAEEIVRLHVMAAMLCAVGVAVSAALMHDLLTAVSAPGNRKQGSSRVLSPLLLHAVSSGTALVLGFSETYWRQAVSVEVYSLHLLLLLVLIWSALRAACLGKKEWWLVFAFATGLSFTNHLTTMLLAPGLLYLYFASEGARRASWIRLARMTPLFFLGLSVYLYLPLRAAQAPVFNWGNPVTWERFLWHVGGKQYRVWIFSSMESAGKQLAYFVSTLPGEFAIIGLLLAVPGLAFLLFRHRRMGVTTVLLFLVCVIYAINYDIHDIDSYFLLAYVIIALWAGCGLAWGVRWWSERFPRFSSWSAVLVYIPAAVLLASHLRDVNERDNYLVEDYTRNMFGSMESNALVLSFQWDYWLSASYYYQAVRGVRTDLAVVDKELLRRSWYLKELEGRMPWLVRGSQGEVDAFLREVSLFERDRPYNPAVIQGRFVGMIRSFLVKSMAERPVYVTPEIEEEFTVGFRRVPSGLAFKLVTDTAFRPTPRPQFVVRPAPRQGRLEDMIFRLYAGAYVARGEYYQGHGNREESLECFRLALAYEPGNTVALMRLRETTGGR